MVHNLQFFFISFRINFIQTQGMIEDLSRVVKINFIKDSFCHVIYQHHFDHQHTFMLLSTQSTFKYSIKHQNAYTVVATMTFTSVNPQYLLQILL